MMSQKVSFGPDKKYARVGFQYIVFLSVKMRRELISRVFSRILILMISKFRNFSKILFEVQNGFFIVYNIEALSKSTFYEFSFQLTKPKGEGEHEVSFSILP